MSRRSRFPQRKRIFLGCEGESERSYGALLARLVESQHQRIFLDTVLLQPGGGDPLALVLLAARRLREQESKRGAYVAAYLLVDADKLGNKPERDRQILAAARKAGLNLIWQEPCHEGLLLRHLPGCEQLRPATTELAFATLKQRWPGYEKNLPAAKLALVLGAEEVRRARRVTDALDRLLKEMGFE